jgi:hypothetical protein
MALESRADVLCVLFFSCSCSCCSGFPEGIAGLERKGGVIILELFFQSPLLSTVSLHRLQQPHAGLSVTAIPCRLTTAYYKSDSGKAY